MNLRAFIQLTRFEHSLMLVLAVIIGQTIALGHLPELWIALLASLPAFLIGLASFAINDFFDVATDRENNRKDRPIVNGSVQEQEAFYLAMVLFAAGSVLSLFLSPNCSAIAGGFAIAAFLYSFRLKDVPLVGNLYIAATMAIPFIYGNYSVLDELKPAVIVLSLIAFVTGVAREIAGDVRDMEGDKKARKSETLPMEIGKNKALMVHSALYILAVLMSFYPYLFVKGFEGNIRYLVPILLTDALILYAAISTLLDDSVSSLKRSRNVSLAALGTGLLGFLLGSL
jgi:geranylgeranylglycerol-phosphate geranylgeranyltransferase